MSVGIDDTGFHASSLCITLIGQDWPGLIDRHKIGNSCPASLDIGLLSTYWRMILRICLVIVLVCCPVMVPGVLEIFPVTIVRASGR